MTQRIRTVRELRYCVPCGNSVEHVRLNIHNDWRCDKCGATTATQPATADVCSRSPEPAPKA